MQQSITSCVPLRLISHCVLLAVDFDDQATFQAGEVGCDRSNRKLTPELQSFRPLSKGLPKQHFRQAQLAT
jgi:hypothetical protein